LLVQYSRLYSSARYNESDTPKESTWYPVQCHAHSLTCLLVVNSEVADGERVAVERWGRPGEPHPVGGNIPISDCHTRQHCSRNRNRYTIFQEGPRIHHASSICHTSRICRYGEARSTVDFELQIFISCHKYFVEWD